MYRIRGKYTLASLFGSSILAATLSLSPPILGNEDLLEEQQKECERLKAEAAQVQGKKNIVKVFRYGTEIKGKIFQMAVPPPLGKAVIYGVTKIATESLKYIEKGYEKKIGGLEKQIMDECSPAGGYDGSDLSGDIDDLNNSFKGLADQLSGDSSGEAENACRDQYSPKQNFPSVEPAKSAPHEQRPNFSKKSSSGSSKDVNDKGGPKENWKNMKAQPGDKIIGPRDTNYHAGSHFS